MSTANHALAVRVEALRRAIGSVTRVRLTPTWIESAAGPVLHAKLPSPAPLQAFGPLRSAQIKVAVELHAEPEPLALARWRERLEAADRGE